MQAALYLEVTDWLHQEAELLDAGQMEDWLALLTDDVTYEMPVRVNRERTREPLPAAAMHHFQDDRVTLQMRVERLQTDFVWAEDPPSRTRHLVTNIRVTPTADPDEVDVKSYFLLYRNRADETGAELLAGERQDRLRRVDGAWKLARRVILVDQSTLGARNLAVFF